MWNIFPRIRKLRYGVMKRVNVHFDELIDARVAMRQAGEATPDDALEAMLNDQQVSFTRSQGVPIKQRLDRD